MMTWPQDIVPPTDMAKGLKRIADKRLVAVDADLRSFGKNADLSDLLRSAYLQGLADGYDAAQKRK